MVPHYHGRLINNITIITLTNIELIMNNKVINNTLIAIGCRLWGLRERSSHRCGRRWCWRTAGMSVSMNSTFVRPLSLLSSPTPRSIVCFCLSLLACFIPFFLFLFVIVFVCCIELGITGSLKPEAIREIVDALVSQGTIAFIKRNIKKGKKKKKKGNQLETQN